MAKNETMEEVLKAAEPARQGLKCARVEVLRELLTMLVFNIESDGTSKYGDYNLIQCVVKPLASAMGI